MINGIRASNYVGLNNECGSKFRVGCWVRQALEEGWRTYRPKRCEYNKKHKNNSPNTLNDKS